MKRIRMMGILIVLSTLLLSGCSDALLERGTGLLDDMFAGARIAPGDSASEPEPAASDPEEPDSSEPAKPAAAPAGNTPAAEPEQPQPQPEQREPAPEPAPSAAVSPEAVTPSHTDATLFSPGESFRYLPKGVTGVYACEYASDNAAVASVDPDTGKVTAVGPGTTKIKMHVEYNGQYDFECVVRCNWKDGEKQDNKQDQSTGGNDEPVLPPAPSEPSGPAAPSAPSSAGIITASHSDATFFNPKEFFRLRPVGAGDDYTSSYSTSNAEVASVDETGKVTAVGPGTAAVTMFVDCGGSEYTFECIVRCNW